MNKKKLAIPLLVMIIVSMACSFGYEGVNFGSDEEIEHIEDLTATAAEQASQLTGPISTLEPTRQPVVRQTSAPEAAQPESAQPEVESAGPKEYSVTAQDFDCVCQVHGNVTRELIIKGDLLEIPNDQGGAHVYEKISENTYRRSWMGYYILVEGEGENATETKVEEERSIVIILTDGGYVMEHYQGTSGSPCCIHTFTQTK